MALVYKESQSADTCYVCSVLLWRCWACSECDAVWCEYVTANTGDD